MLEEILESPLDCKVIQLVYPEGNQPWIFTARTDAEVEAPTLQSPDVKSWLTGKDPDAGKDWRQEKGKTEDEMVGWHHQLMDMGLSKLWKMVKDREARHLQSMGSQRVRYNWVANQQQQQEHLFSGWGSGKRKVFVQWVQSFSL